MRYLLHSTLTFSAPSRAILYDEATKLAHDGHEVFVLYCDGCLDICFTNMTGNKKGCLMCRANYRYFDRINISSKVRFVSLKEYLTPDVLLKSNNLNFSYSNTTDIKNIKLNGINIGLASFSSYITYTRNLNPLIDNKFKQYFDVLLRNSARMCEIASLVIEEIKPNSIYGYNGRFLDSRPFWEISKNMGIPFILLEAQYTFSSCKKVLFYNETPQSITASKKIMQDIWNNCDLDINDKISKGSDFYERRRNALYAGDKIYTLNQKLGLLPEKWNSNKKNIVIFISSEDEFASIGDEFDKYSLFHSQIDGIREILHHFKYNYDIQFYLRIHPNLSNIKYSYHKNLYDFALFENINIIDAHSNISSYSLIDYSDKVIVFGSTIGIEAVYWSKPTILLSGSFYYLFDCCYIPKSKNELFDLIASPLVPKDRMVTYKYGLQYHDSIGQTCEFVNCNWKTFYFKFLIYKKSITINYWEKLFGSKLLFYIFRFLSSRFLLLYGYFMKFGAKYIIPINEDNS